MCHGSPTPGWRRCWSCNKVTAQVSKPCRKVLPMSLYQVPGPLHSCLRNYKDYQPGGTMSGPTVVQRSLAKFIELHASCIAGDGQWDLVVVVPSSTNRQGEHPLHVALSYLAVGDTNTSGLLTCTQPGLVGHCTASDRAFSVRGDVAGAKVTVLDDTWTTGARAQSVASSLALSGAHVLAIVVVGRVISPRFALRTSVAWKAAARERFNLSKCCLEDRRSEEDRGAPTRTRLAG